ncbi:MAG: MFS transporter [Alphaproteobacteria bacterium]|nr:MFS transporter [Alphaproteobacteria bacterium]
MAVPNWAGALGSTLAAQIVTAFLMSSVVVSAPLLTADMGVPVEKIGYFSAISTLASMWYLMCCGPLLPHFGPLRLLQGGLVLAAGGMALLLPASWGLFLLGAVLVGIAYGPVPPASSEILARQMPPGRRALAFSIKQAGVPAGHALGGLLVPPLALLVDWRLGILVAMSAVLLVALAVQPWRARLDVGYSPQRPLSLAAMLSPANALQTLRTLRSTPGLTWLSYVGFCFACAQGGFFSFYVAHMTESVGLAVTLAGAAYAVLQVTGAAGRITAGWLADRFSARIVLTGLAFAASLAALLTASLEPGLPWPALLAAAAFSGLAAVSWNGVYLAEVARIAPQGRVGEATSASTFLAFTGYATGPAAFALLVGQTGSYALAFSVLAVLPLTGGLSLLHIRHTGSPAGPG